MNLLVDIGNTRIKWACAEDNVLFGHNACAYTPDTLAALLLVHWRALQAPQQVHVASVAASATTAALCGYVRSTWNLEAQLAVTAREQAGLRNAYHDVNTMGVDRWLALLAAWRRHHRPLCVLDCGTALTADVILGNGRHAGGFILPGLTLTAATLAQETQGIHEQSIHEHGAHEHGAHEHREQALQADFGRSTAACINNGFACALTGLLAYCAGKLKEEQGAEPMFIVTGGAAAQILPLLPEQTLHEPHLVLEGLQEANLQ
ncbi:MAG: type III pantothenate kinase [Gammaproteobacteria bacterium]|nr:type III pantothenate kinase [Gammaproteobacteria bacterium]